MDIKVVLKPPRWPLAGAAGGSTQSIAAAGLYKSVTDADAKQLPLTLEIESVYY